MRRDYWNACVSLPVWFLSLPFSMIFKNTPHLSPVSLQSGSSATVLSTSACICPADQRSIWGILWSCLATIFACSWVSVHPNIPAPNESWWRVLLRRIELMFWAVVGPEMVIAWAFRQWTSARHLKKLYKGELSSLYIKSNAFDLITNTNS